MNHRTKTTVAFVSTALTAFGAGWIAKPPQEKLVASAAPSLAAIEVEKPAAARLEIPAGIPVEVWTGEWEAALASVRAAAVPGEVNQVLVAKAKEALLATDPYVRSPRWSSLLALIRAEDVRAVCEVFSEQDKHGRWYTEEFFAFWQQRGKVLPVAGAEELFRAKEPFPKLLEPLFHGWASTNTREAVTWLDEQPLDSPHRSGAIRGIMAGVLDHDPVMAQKVVLANITDPDFRSFAPQLATTQVYHYGVDQAKAWFAQFAASEVPEDIKMETYQQMHHLIKAHVHDGSHAAFASQYEGQTWMPNL
jgi:hypothetical protein